MHAVAQLDALQPVQDEQHALDAVQEIEVFGLRELLRLGDALGEAIPGHDGLNDGERIAARLLGLEAPDRSGRADR